MFEIKSWVFPVVAFVIAALKPEDPLVVFEVATISIDMASRLKLATVAVQIAVNLAYSIMTGVLFWHQFDNYYYFGDTFRM